MSFHHDLAQWLFLAKKENYPYCLKTEDPTESTTLKLFKYSDLNDPFASATIDYHRVEPPVYQGNEFHKFAKKMERRLREIEL